MNRQFYYLIFVFVSVLFFSCQNDTHKNSSSQTPSQPHDHNHDHSHSHEAETPHDFDYGKIEKQVYSNNFFNFQINIPSSWHTINQDEMAKAAEQGSDLVESGEAAEIAAGQLLNISQHPINSDVVFNSTMIITADNISAFPELQNGKDYLEHTKETFSAMGMDIQIVDDISERVISNKKFHHLEIKINFGDGSISQQYISAVIKEYIFNIVLTYGNEEGKAELEKILNTYQILN